MAGADSFIQVAPDDTGKKMDTTELAVAGSQVHRERVQISDKDDPDGHARVTDTAPGASEYGVVTRAAGTTPVSGTVAVSNFPATQPISVAEGADVAQGSTTDAESTSGNGTIVALLKRIRTILGLEAGIWAYKAGSSGTVVIPAGGRVLSFGCHATVPGSFTINGGDSVPVPALTGIEISPKGNLTAPTFEFTGTDSYFVEYVS